MDRSTRDKFASGTDESDLTTGNAVWETAPLIFRQLNQDYGPFDVDLTADAQRALCPVWFGPGSGQPNGQDALAAEWNYHGTNGYSNPPYGSFIQRILPKARLECSLGFTSLFLLPMRVTKVFKSHVLVGASDLIFPDKRLTFFESGVPRINEKLWQGKRVPRADPALFDSVLVRYQAHWPVSAAPRLSIWNVPVHVTAADLDRAAERRRSRAA